MKVFGFVDINTSKNSKNICLNKCNCHLKTYQYGKYKKSNKKRKSKRRPTKKRRPMKKRMRGGAPLSPALFSNEAARVDPNIIDSATYSVGDNLNGESALANPPPVVRTNGCLV